jgi:hypothetical protein
VRGEGFKGWRVGDGKWGARVENLRIEGCEDGGIGCEDQGSRGAWRGIPG